MSGRLFPPGSHTSPDSQEAVLPGPPHEMRPMFLNRVIPFLMKDATATIRSKTVHIFGMGESQAEQILHDMMTTSTNPTIAPYAKPVGLEVRVSAKAQSEDAAIALIDPVVEEIQRRLGDVVYGVDVGNLQTALVNELLAKGRTVATAESCTGGGVSRAITDVPGSSKVFGCGVCTYANDMKEKLLGVSEETLMQHGAVSAQTAQQMARGVRKLSGADIGIGITGLAGPGGGSEEKPVGLVYMAVDSDALTEVKRLTLSRGHKDQRDFIRRYATLHALSFLLTAAKKA